MVKIFGIDIPFGLDEAFFRIFQFGDNTTQSKLILKSARPTRAKKNAWNIRSLFVLWQDLYNSFDIGRRGSWEAYWLTLPFSDHGGGGGWPGSGYSAFVYVNAPRYQLGLDPLLDPPVSNLLTNGNFNGNTTGWFLSGVWEYDDHDVKVLGGDYGGGSSLFQNLNGLVNGGSYHLSFKIKFATTDEEATGDPNVFMSASLGSDGFAGDLPLEFHFNDGEWHTVGGDLTAYTQPDPELNPFRLYPGYLGVLYDSYVYVTDIVLTPNF